MDATGESKATASHRLSRLPQPRPVSGIPKPSSALPRPASTIRPSPAVDTKTRAAPASTLAGDVRSPRLRSVVSRDQLRSNTTAAASRNPHLRTSASQGQLRAVASPRTVAPKATHPPVSKSNHNRVNSTPQRRPSTTPDTSPAVESEPRAESAADDADEFLFKRRLTLTRRPSEVFSASPLEESSNDGLETKYGKRSRRNSTVDDQTGYEPARTSPIKPRPSLSERTMETLSTIPPSPALKKKSSSFFDQGRSTSRSQSRPGSSYNSDGSAQTPTWPSSSRPGSGDGSEDLTAAPPSNHTKSTLPSLTGTPRARGTATQAMKTPVLKKSTSRLSLASSSKPLPRAPETAVSSTPERKPYGSLATPQGSRTTSSRTVKPRGSVNGLFKKPSLPAINSATANAEAVRNASQFSAQSSGGSWDGTIPSNASATSGSTSLTSESTESTGISTIRKSSAALRDQIAQAKAAKRAAMKQAPSSQFANPLQSPIVPQDDGFDFGMGHDDPFNQNKGTTGKNVLNQRIKTARTNGRLDIAGLGLKDMPLEVLKMYDLSNMGANDGSWAESVDLTRLVAADNEFERLDDSVFPDVDPDSLNYDDDTLDNIFLGLETLDLHSNLLIGVPIGFRRLAHVTSLNLSSNRLTNDSIEAISQMAGLRDLKLANNLFYGPLHSDLSNLESLEVLDLHGNNISALPRNVDKMSRLRILNLSENSLESLPFDELAKLPLTELLLKKNKLSGTLIEDSIDSLPQLHTLDVSLNQLTRMVPLGSSISFPVLHVLSLSMNRLQGLPDMTSWTNLLTLAVEENSISSIPNSFTTLEKLRHADFSGNDIRVVPPEISRMTNLAMIRLSGNPLRDKKFVSITTEELKEILASRLEPPPPYQESRALGAAADITGDSKSVGAGPQASHVPGKESPRGDDLAEDSRSDLDDDFATPPTSAPHSPSRSRSHTNSSLRSRSRTLSNQVWPVKQGGILDRSRTESSSLHPVVCSRVATDNVVKEVRLNNNLFGALPDSLSFFAGSMTSLSLAHNQLVGEAYLTEEMDLPALKELNLSSNRITSLTPLVKFLRAPELQKLDVSLNRINGLPSNMKEAFPNLAILLAADNQIPDLDPESIRGLKVVDASSNEIAHLNPRIGLLGGSGGLQKLDVMGNRFRVPRWNVLERGTEATLRWLRGRVPVAEMGAWNGDDDGEGVD